MDYINKQKFLTELGRLLTFMYEEDRQTALSMYNRMFDETDDEQGLLQLLVSPTRQAVIIARTYDAKERKLQVHTQSRDEYAVQESEQTPEFILAIERIYEQSLSSLPARIAVPKEQCSLFDEPWTDDTDSDAEPETPEAAVEVPEEPDAPEVTVEAPEAAVEAPEDETPAAPAEEPPTQAAPAADEAAAEPEAPAAGSEEAASEYERWTGIGSEAVRTERKTSVGLLIVYIILAIPLTLLGIAILLIPALLFLALSLASVYVGIMIFNAALSSFSVLADKMVLIGIGITLLALGLLFVWIFIWFLAGAAAGLVRGVFVLGRKLCCKEVAKQ